MQYNGTDRSNEFEGRASEVQQPLHKRGNSNLARHPSSLRVPASSSLTGLDTSSQQDYQTLDIGPPSPGDPATRYGVNGGNALNGSGAPGDVSAEDSIEFVRAYEPSTPVLPTTNSRPESPFLPSSGSFQGQRIVSGSNLTRSSSGSQLARSASGSFRPAFTSAVPRNVSNATFVSAYEEVSQDSDNPKPRGGYPLARHGSDTYRSHSEQRRNVSQTLGEPMMNEKARSSSGLSPNDYHHGGATAYGQVSEKGDPYAAHGGSNAKYANLIPEQRPPQSPLEYAQWFWSNETCMLVMYTLLSLFTRLYRIGKNASVVWDEAHFGKFGSHYLKHEFYFDVHPPLGKMLVGLAGLLSGYGGQFEFKSGEAYPADVNYVGMRIIMAMFGVGMVPLAWSSSGTLGWNWRTRHILTLMVLCDNAWLVISRFILLDSMLLFFTFTTVLGLLMFHRQQHDSFGEKWWFWLSFTGISIGCVASVKWVGLFATALVGLYTIEDLWNKFGDLNMPVRRYARHWCARILCLMVLPLSVYMMSFKLHFMILNRSGPGDAQMSSLFQAHLKGNNFAQAPLEAAYGSKVTFKNMGYGGGLLHSHVQTYPVGSQQQQVTCYHYRDNNNEFTIQPRFEDPPVKEDEAPRFVKSGNVIRLVHAATGRNLHSHNVPAPVTKENLEVSGYGNMTIGDSNDYWAIEVVDDMTTGKKGKEGDPVRSLTTRVRFRHLNQNCYMRAANAILPQWGWKQVEVSCDKENNPKDEHTYWNIETHVNDKLPTGNTKLYKSPFLRDFVHLNVAMMTSNNALIPDQDKEDILASKPVDWPWLYNGLRMNGWGDQNIKYYLVGNPIIWWGSSASLIVYCLTYLWYKARMQRRIVDLSPQDWDQFTFAGKVAGLGWFLHYLPFLLMARVCYIHHYLPTLYFAVLMLAHVLDHFLWNASTARYRARGTGRAGTQAGRVPLSEGFKNLTFFLCAALIVGVFWWFRETAWGMEGPVWQRQGIKWRKSWNIKD